MKQSFLVWNFPLVGHAGSRKVLNFRPFYISDFQVRVAHLVPSNVFLWHFPDFYLKRSTLGGVDGDERAVWSFLYRINIDLFFKKKVSPSLSLPHLYFPGLRILIGEKLTTYANADPEEEGCEVQPEDSRCLSFRVPPPSTFALSRSRFLSLHPVESAVGGMFIWPTVLCVQWREPDVTWRVVPSAFHQRVWCLQLAVSQGLGPAGLAPEGTQRSAPPPACCDQAHFLARLWSPGLQIKREVKELSLFFFPTTVDS